MAKASLQSPAAVIFKIYPDAFWNAASAITKVTYIDSADGETRNRLTNHVLQRIAEHITRERRSFEVHFQEKQRRENLPHNQRIAQTQPLANNISTDTDFDAIFGEILPLLEGLDQNSNTSSQLPPPVHRDRLSFILVDEQARVRTKLFPRTFHCKNCGHFTVLNPGQPPATLTCPCCHRDKLIQEPIVFGCARCANIKELFPKGERIGPGSNYRRSIKIENYLNAALACPECGVGHIHLEKHNTNSIISWEWRCQSCEMYKEAVREVCFNCYLPSDTPGNTGDIVSMSAFPASASNALSPLVDVQMFLKDVPLEPTSFREAATRSAENWSDYFELEPIVSVTTSTLNSQEKATVRDACIANAYLLNEVRVVTTVYGYRGGNIMNHPRSPIQVADRLARFFSDPEGFADYQCYGMINEGAALVLELDKDQIANRLAVTHPGLNGYTFEEILEEEQQRLEPTSLRDLLQLRNNDFPLLSSLHAIEHSILINTHRQIGNTVVGSVLFPRAGIVFLYEREPIGRGGVIQLVNKGQGLLSLILATADHVFGCAQGCLDGCPSCSYINDMYCHYHQQDFNNRWYPPNILLSRTGARNILRV
jgi:hypothetical protein